MCDTSKENEKMSGGCSVYYKNPSQEELEAQKNDPNLQFKMAEESVEEEKSEDVMIIHEPEEQIDDANTEIIELYLDGIRAGKEMTWFKEPPFDVIKEVSEASFDILAYSLRKIKRKMNAVEIEMLVNAIKKFGADRYAPVYSLLPQFFKDHVKFLYEWHQSKFSRGKINNETTIDDVAHIVLTQIINDISMDVIFAKLEQDQFEMAKEQAKQTDAIFNDIFNKEDELEAETPGVGKNIQAVKAAFEMAKNFDVQLEYLNSDSRHNIKRYHQHFNGDMVAFNKFCMGSKFRLIGVNDHLVTFLKANLDRRFKDKKYTTDEVKDFLVLVMRSLQKFDISDLQGAAYIHRLIDSIHRLRYIEDPSEDKAVFENIAAMIDAMRKVINDKGPKGGRR